MKKEEDTPMSERKEYSNTYMVQDRSSGEELTRLHLQDEMLTNAMGGVLPEQPDPVRFQRVIDIGCGTGGWIINVAKAYPSIELLIGVDISSMMVKDAQSRAEKAGVANRVEFHVMDSLRMIEFPRGYFDLVNHRLNFSYLRTWDWPNLLQKYQWAARPGGVIRVTEPEILAETNSPALNKLYEIGLDAFWRAGHLFNEGRQGVIDALPALFHQQGIREVQTRLVSTKYTESPELRSSFVDDNRLIFHTSIPFLRKWSQVPQEYEQIYKQALLEMKQPDFRAEGKLLTVWGNNSGIKAAAHP